MPFTQFEANLSVDNREFISGLRSAQTAVDAFAKRFEQKVAGGLIAPGSGAQRFFNTIKAESPKAGSAIGMLTQRIEKMGNVFTTGLGLGVAYAGLNALTGAFTRAIEKAREFQTGILSIAAAQASAFDIKQGDKILQGAEAFKASMAIAQEANQRILKRSTENILTYREQLNAYLVSTAQASKLDLNVDQQLKLSEGLAVAAKAIGLQGQQISQQVRAVLGGANVQKTVLGSALGLTNAEVRRMKETGTLFTELMDRVRGFTAGDKEFESSIEGMLSQFENAIDVFLAGAGKQIAKAVAVPLKEIEKFLKNTGGRDLGEALGTIFANFLTLLLKIAQSPAIPVIMKFLDLIGKFGDKLVIIGIFTKLIGLFQGLVVGGLSFVQMLSRIAGESTKAAAGLTAMNAAASAGPMGRGPNAPGRFGAAPSEAPVVMPVPRGKGFADPSTGKFVSKAEAQFAEQTMRAQALGTSIQMAAQKGMIEFEAATARTIKGQFLSLKKQIAEVDASRVVARIGLAAAAYGLLDYGFSWIRDQIGLEGPAKDAFDQATSAVQGAVAGGMLAGPLGALGGAVLSYLQTLASSVEEAEKQAKRAEEDYETMIASMPEVAKVQGIKEMIRIKKAVLASGNLTEKGIKATEQSIAALEQQLNEARKAGTIVRSRKFEARNFIEELEKMEKAFGLLPETLNNRLQKAIISVTKKLDQIQEMGDEDIAALSTEGESPEQTRLRVSREIVVAGMEDAAKQLQDAAREADSLGRQLQSSAIAVKNAKQEFNNFVQDIPKVRQEALNRVNEASKTYLTGLTKTSQVASDLVQIIDKRRHAEAETTAMSKMYGISQSTLINTLYDFKQSTTAAGDIQRYFADRVRAAAEAHDNAKRAVLETEKALRDNARAQQRTAQEMEELSVQAERMKDEYDRSMRSALSRRLLLGSGSSATLSDAVSRIQKDAEASAFALHQLGISGVKSADELDRIVKQGGPAVQAYLQRVKEDADKRASDEYEEADDAIARVKEDYQKALTDQVMREAETFERLQALKDEEAKLLEQKATQEKEASEKAAELAQIQAQQQLALSQGFQTYLDQISYASDSLAQGELAMNSYNLGTAMRDYHQKIASLGDQTIELQNRVADAAMGFQTTKERLSELNTQLAVAQKEFRSNISRIMFGHSGDIKMDIAVPVKVDAVLKELVDPATLQKTVNDAIQTYITQSCRAAKR